MATMARYNFPAVDYDSLWAKSGFADAQLNVTTAWKVFADMLAII
jgi:hypothetical protein